MNTKQWDGMPRHKAIENLREAMRLLGVAKRETAVFRMQVSTARDHLTVIAIQGCCGHMADRALAKIDVLDEKKEKSDG